MARPWLAALTDLFSSATPQGRTEARRTGPYLREHALGARSTAALTADDAPSPAAGAAEALPMHVTPELRHNSLVVRAWRRLLHFCETDYEELRDTLSWPATTNQLNELQHQLGQVLPTAVCEWLLCCNGQDVDANVAVTDGLFFGLPFLGTDAILREWQFWRMVDRDPETGANPRLKARMKSCPPQWVRAEYACAGWIPLIADGNGNYVGVDLTPNPSGGGRAGQVILFGRDFDTKVVVFGCDGPDGWAKFLMSVAEELENRRSYVIRSDVDADADSPLGTEDEIGYQSYFDAAGDRGGEGKAQFRLVGPYARWPVLDAWADRSLRAWAKAGLPAARTVEPPSPSLTNISEVSTSSSVHDPMDPLAALPRSAQKGRFDTPRSSRPSTPRSRRGSVWPRRNSTDSAMSTTTPTKRRPAPRPAPLVDLPTMDDLRAAEASELAQAPARAGRLDHLLPLSLASATGGTSLRYRNVDADSVAVTMDEPADADEHASLATQLPPLDDAELTLRLDTDAHPLAASPPTSHAISAHERDPVAGSQDTLVAIPSSHS